VRAASAHAQGDIDRAIEYIAATPPARLLISGGDPLSLDEDPARIRVVAPPRDPAPRVHPDR